METTATSVISEIDHFLAERHELLDRPEGFTRDLLHQLHDLGCFRVFIPQEHGGLYEHYSDAMAMVSAAAYHSLELSLMLGITSSLFLMPISRYSHPATRAAVLEDFQARRLLGGMMMTEPDFGTNIMGIATRFRPEGAGYRLQGAKHWAGLSGMGDYWLVSARKERASGALGRDIDFFIVRSDQPGFCFTTAYPAAGLTSIPYGRTTLDVLVPETYKLCGPNTNIRVMYDILNRSRISIAAIADGACRRILEDSEAHANARVVFGKPLVAYEQVQYRLAGMQAASVICSCAARFAGNLLNTYEAPEPFIEMLTANIIKVVTSDLLQMSAQSAVQVRGGQGFRKDHYIGKAFTDSRPFQIFEGSNDVLYEVIATQLSDEARKLGLPELRDSLAKHPCLPPPDIADDRMRHLPMETEDSQVDRVLFGKVISRYTAIGIVQQIARADPDLRPELRDSAIAYLRAECEQFQNERTTRYRSRYI
jgi:alkylation response protein AidB-like acyl-CoA dehydrogenase